MSETIAHKHTRRRQTRRISPIWPILGGLIFLALIIVGVLAIVSTDKADLTLTLQGEATVTLEFGSSYTEPGFRALYGQQDISAAVTAAGNINPDKLGTYTVTYTVKYEGQTATAQRTVLVVDTTAPTITLLHNDNSFTLPGQPYEEEGFVAEDNYDGNITDKVQRIEENGAILYRVEDSSGNRTEVRRTIKYGDTTPPVLTLLGNATVTISAGTLYQEPGYTAIDNVDGDISAKVQMQGAIDIYSPGSYTITYSVTDSYGNTATATRTVVVQRASQPPVINPGEKIIYLTFDDGPSQHTGRLLEILKKYDVKATFFVVGSANLNYLKQMVADGHAIGLHSNTHDYNKIYASEEAFFNDMNVLRQKIKDICGVDTTLMRFPGGGSNTVSRFNPGIMTRLTKAVVDQGYQYFDWNVDSRDAGGAKTADEVYNNVIKGVQQHGASVVLQHDICGFSVDAVERIIQWGLANGYTFLPLDSTSPGAHHGVNN